MEKDLSKDAEESGTGFQSNDRRFYTIAEIKDFVLWAKEQKIKEVTLGSATIHFSDLAFVPDMTQDSEVTKPTKEQAEKDYYQDLFYSVQG